LRHKHYLIVWFPIPRSRQEFVTLLHFRTYPYSLKNTYNGNSSEISSEDGHIGKCWKERMTLYN